jgi:hypothetical protein
LPISLNGNGSITIEGGSLQAGSYYYKLIADAEEASKFSQLTLAMFQRCWNTTFF